MWDPGCKETLPHQHFVTGKTQQRLACRGWRDCAVRDPGCMDCSASPVKNGFVTLHLGSQGLGNCCQSDGWQAGRDRRDCAVWDPGCADCSASPVKTGEVILAARIPGVGWRAGAGGTVRCGIQDAKRYCLTSLCHRESTASAGWQGLEGLCGAGFRMQRLPHQPLS